MLEECDLTEEDAMLMIYNSDGQLQYKVYSYIYISVCTCVYVRVYVYTYVTGFAKMCIVRTFVNI